MTNEEIKAKVAEEIARLGKTRESMLVRLREVGAVPRSGGPEDCLFAAHFRRVIPGVPFEVRFTSVAFEVGFTSVAWGPYSPGHVLWLPLAGGKLVQEFLDAINYDGVPPEKFVARATEGGR